MKTVYKFMILAIGFVLASCEGEIGPQGPPGIDGLDGLDGEEGYVFEYEFDLTAPDYSVFLNLPTDFVMLKSDVMLVYLLWEVTDDGLEIWRALPQTLYFEGGELLYNYDFSLLDAHIFLDGTVDFDGLGAIYTDAWIARVVVIPAQFTGRTSIDYSDYEQVKVAFGLSESKLASKEYHKRP